MNENLIYKSLVYGISSIPHYKFDKLFGDAINCWPEFINLEKIWTGDSSPEEFIVVGLEELSDQISEYRNGSPEELLWCTINYAIYLAILGAAKAHNFIKTADISSQYVKRRLERDLIFIMSREIDGWSVTATKRAIDIFMDK